MQTSEEQFYSRAYNAIHTGSIEDLRSIWKDSYNRGEAGLFVRGMISKRIFFLADRFGIRPCMFDFEQFVELAQKRSVFISLQREGSADMLLSGMLKANEAERKELKPLILEGLKFFSLRSLAKAIYLLILDSQNLDEVRSLISKMVKHIDRYLNQTGLAKVSGLSLVQQQQELIMYLLDFIRKLPTSKKISDALDKILEGDLRNRFRRDLEPYQSPEPVTSMELEPESYIREQKERRARSRTPPRGGKGKEPERKERPSSGTEEGEEESEEEESEEEDTE